jgi:hypothetical protein
VRYIVRFEKAGLATIIAIFHAPKQRSGPEVERPKRSLTSTVGTPFCWLADDRIQGRRAPCTFFPEPRLHIKAGAHYFLYPTLALFFGIIEFATQNDGHNAGIAAGRIRQVLSKSDLAECIE